MFNEIVIQCINKGIVSGETMVADGSFLPANVSVKSSVEVIETVQQSSIHYLDELEKEMSELPGYQPSMTKEITKRSLKSSTDPDCGYINQKNKKGLGYLTEMTVDTDCGIITGMDCYSANHRESDIVLNHLKSQKEALPIELETIALDGGYDVGAVHRDWNCWEWMDTQQLEYFYCSNQKRSTDFHSIIRRSDGVKDF